MFSLEAQLKERRDASRTRLPAETVEVMDKATAQLATAKLAFPALGVGDKAPEFNLPNAIGKYVSLGDLLSKGPAVISFYRGGWCPYCNLELKALQSAISDIQSLGATLVAISPQTPDNSLSTKEKLELAFPVLSDQGNRVANEFGLVFTLSNSLKKVYDGFGNDLPATNGDDSFTLPIPATYVVATDGTIVFAFADPDYTRRAEPNDVIASLRRLRTSG